MKSNQNDDKAYKSLVSRIRQRRIDLKISQMQLADLIQCHINTIGRIERLEAKDFSVKTLIKISRALKLNCRDLFPD